MKTFNVKASNWKCINDSCHISALSQNIPLLVSLNYQFLDMDCSGPFVFLNYQDIFYVKRQRYFFLLTCQNGCNLNMEHLWGLLSFWCWLCFRLDGIQYPYHLYISPSARPGTNGPDRPFQCPTCGVRFTRIQNLKQHMLIHSGRWNEEIKINRDQEQVTWPDQLIAVYLHNLRYFFAVTLLCNQWRQCIRFGAALFGATTRLHTGSSAAQHL